MLIGAPGQPDNYQNNQNKLMIMGIINERIPNCTIGQWDDCHTDGRIANEDYFATDRKGYVIEWD